MENQRKMSFVIDVSHEHPTAQQETVILPAENGESEQVLLQLKNVENEIKILHDTIDQCVDEVVSTSDLWLKNAEPRDRLNVYDVSQIIKKLTASMKHKCSGFCQRMQQWIDPLGVEIHPKHPEFPEIVKDKSVVRSYSRRSVAMQRKMTCGKQNVKKACGKLMSCKKTSERTLETRESAQAPKIFKCEICEKEFRSKASQKAHARYHNYDLKYKCVDCGRGYPTKSYLERHIMTHTGERPHKCDICHKGFYANSMLEEHKKTHLPEQPIYTCDLCERTYTRKRSLILHQWIHREDNPYKCHICGHAFTGWNSVYEHIKTHTGEKPFKCEVCEKMFVRKTHLTKHMEVHMEVKVKPHRCKECDKGFISIYALNVHMVTHNPDTPYLCDFCGKGFKYQVSLRHHKNLHAPSRPLFKCDICGNSYKTENYLKVHKRIHLKGKTYKCDLCGSCFREKLQLSYHKWVHADERPHKCQICQKSFVLQSQLKKHSEIHRADRPFCCDICEKNFKSKYEVNIHRKKVHEKKRKAQLEKNVTSPPKLTSSQIQSTVGYSLSTYKNDSNVLLSRADVELQREQNHDMAEPVRPAYWAL